jgi:hypothetical protein
MQLSPATTSLLTSINSFSGGKLTRGDDLGVLIETATSHAKRDTLDELSFLAKFVSRIYGIMQRIGKDGEGYQRVAEQFTLNLEKATALVRLLIGSSPTEIQRHFNATYFVTTTTALQNLLNLFYDLSWYKNWRLDHPDEER